MYDHKQIGIKNQTTRFIIKFCRSTPFMALEQKVAPVNTTQKILISHKQFSSIRSGAEIKNDSNFIKRTDFNRFRNQKLTTVPKLLKNSSNSQITREIIYC